MPLEILFHRFWYILVSTFVAICLKVHQQVQKVMLILVDG